MDHSRWDRLTNLILIAVVFTTGPEGYHAPHNDVWSLNPSEHLMGLVWFELGFFRFQLQRLNPLGCSPCSLQLNSTDLSKQHTQYLGTKSCFNWVTGILAYCFLLVSKTVNQAPRILFFQNVNVTHSHFEQNLGAWSSNTWD